VVSAHKDHNTYYVTRNTSRKDDPNGKQYKILLHHIIIGKPPKGFEVDHKDGDGLNNQRDNLRIVTNRKNHHNQIGHRKGRLVGATYHKRDKIWEAQIRINKDNKHLGYFNTEIEAHYAYIKALEDIV
jgi:hypothetical protein